MKMTETEKAEERQRLECEVNCLISQLTATNSPIGDWKVIKIYEARLQDEPDPYDFAELAAARQKVRDDINALQTKIKKLA